MPNIKFLTNSILGEYNQQPGPWTSHPYWTTHPRKPPFHLWYVPFMLADPTIQMALLWIRGRIISQARFSVEDESGVTEISMDPQPSSILSPEDQTSPLKEFIIRSLRRFWRTSVGRILTALEWGFSGHEIIYRIRNGFLEFDNIRAINPYDVRPVSLEGKKVGILVKRVPGRRGRVYVGGPKSFWFVHRREVNAWFGQSKLFGAFEPWHEMWSDGGAKDIRRLYYFKYAYRGDSLYYPPGVTGSADGANPAIRSNKDIARELVEKRKTGAVSVFPYVIHPQTGEPMWQWSSPEPGPGSVDVRDYYADLKDDMREGMGVPPEVFNAAETGSGFSGRAIPAEGFDASMQEDVNWLVEDYDDQSLQYQVAVNFGPEAAGSYQIITHNLGDIQKTARDLEHNPNERAKTPLTIEPGSRGPTRQIQ